MSSLNVNDTPRDIDHKGGKDNGSTREFDDFF